MYIYTLHIVYVYMFTHIFMYIYTYIYIKNMHENTFELIPLKAILTKKIISNEAEKSKEWMELPNGWKFLCYTLTL